MGTSGSDGRGDRAMITSDERRAIAARIDGLLDGGREPWWSDEYACVMGRSLPNYTKGNQDRAAVMRRIRELCESPDEGEEYKRGFDEGFNAADDWYVEKGDEELAAHGLLRMPRDADGMPIRLGDMLETTRGGTEVGEVTHIEYQEGAVMMTIGFECDSSVTDLARHFRHHLDTCASLADEIDRWVDSEQDPDEPYEPLRSIARRLREMKGDAR